MNEENIVWLSPARQQWSKSLHQASNANIEMDQHTVSKFHIYVSVCNPLDQDATQSIKIPPPQNTILQTEEAG